MPILKRLPLMDISKYVTIRMTAAADPFKRYRPGMRARMINFFYDIFISRQKVFNGRREY